MPARRSLLVTALLLPLLLLAGCRIETINYFPEKSAQVRFANYVPDAAGMDVLVDTAAFWSGIAPEAVTPYKPLDPVQHTFALRITGTAAQTSSADYSLNGEQNYTLIAYGTAALTSTVMVGDFKDGPGSGNFRARVLSFAPNVAAVDMYLTAPDADIANLSPNANAKAVAYGSVGVLDNYPPGASRIRFTTAGTKTVIYDSGPVTLPGDTNANLVVYSRGSGTLVNLAMLQTTGAATATTLESNAARVRALHLANDTGALNLLANQAVLFPNLGYGVPADYASVANASYDFTAEAVATPGAVLATLGRALAPATDTTLYVRGDPGSQAIVALADDNIPALSGLGRLRIVNVTGNGATIDVLAGTTVIASGITPTSTPAYLDIAVGTYTLTVRDTATGAVLPAQVSYTSAISTVYTLYVAGTATQATLVLAKER